MARKKIIRIVLIVAAVLFWHDLADAQNHGYVQSGQGGEELIEGQQAGDQEVPDPFAGVESADQYQAALNAMAGVVGVAGAADSTYTLGINDIIEISVIRHPEVSGEYMINNEGKIQYEFVGDINIAGMTKEEAKDLVTDHLSTYIVSPQVTVKILGYNSKIVYVYGEVGRPGKIFMRGDTITVREALLEAGLPLLSASLKRSVVITPSAQGDIEKKKIDVDALLYKGDLKENLVMNPGDTLYIPPTFLSKTMRAIQPVTAPISNAAGAGRSIYTGGF